MTDLHCARWEEELSYCLVKLHLYVTYDCGLGCSHCWQNSQDRQTTQLTVSQVQKVLEALPQPPLRTTVLGGEPLQLADDVLLELTEPLKAAGSHLTLQTNLQKLPSDALLERFGTVSTSYEPGRNVDPQQLAEKLRRIETKGKPTIVLATMTRAFLDTEPQRLAEIYFRQLRPDVMYFSCEKLTASQLKQSPSHYRETSQKLLELAKYTPFLWQRRTAPMKYAFPSSTGVLGGSVPCNKRLSLSLHPGGWLAPGPFLAEERICVDTAAPEEIRSWVARLKTRRECAGCSRRVQCLETLGTSDRVIIDDSQECVGLKSYFEALKDLRNVFAVSDDFGRSM